MKITIIPSDNFISIDGVALVFPFSAAPNIHAIQWDGASGAIETSNGSQHFSTDLADVQPFIDAYNAEAARLAAIVAPPPTPEQVVANLTSAVQAYLDTTARTRNYDGILSLCSYAASAHPKFGAEGLAGVAWRDAVWAACYSIMADVQAGTRAVPTAAQLLAEMPPMVWPA